MVKVGDIMSREFASVAPSAPVIEVAQKMANCKDGVIAVCNNGKFMGIITERDIITGTVANALNPKREHARNLMSNHQPVISPDDEILDAARTMVNSGLRVLPVVQRAKLVGLFTVDDLAQESLPLASLVFTRTIKPKSPEPAMA
ncbi:MAG: CBS domain-containing protein [Dehalococcoidia bacterium]|nr:CBS domain-containing protein [Dehalococcoidia bacterium]